MGESTQSSLDSLNYDDVGCRWFGPVNLRDGEAIEVSIRVGRRDPEVALALARLAFPLIVPRINEAKSLAAKQLLEYYNVFNAHLKNGEQIDEAEFAHRLELEAISFTNKGSSTLEFRHGLYRGYRNFEGGLIVVRARFDGEFRKAAWVTAADADEWRSARGSGYSSRLR